MAQTIAALSTAPGGRDRIVRISGDQAEAYLHALFTPARRAGHAAARFDLWR